MIKITLNKKRVGIKKYFHNLVFGKYSRFKIPKHIFEFKHIFLNVVF